MTIRPKKQCAQNGMAAIEFALIFPVLFLMLYGLLTYSLIFAIQHSLSLAAAEGGRAAVRFIQANDDIGVRKNAACKAAEDALVWMRKIGISIGCSATHKIIVEEKKCPSPVSSKLHCLDISVKYAYAAHPVIPVLLPVPASLTGHSLTQISLSF